MTRYVLLILSIFLISCKTQTYFVVRHAEKEINTMASDVALSEEGKQRAVALSNILKDENIQQVYSTDYLRTRSTAGPLAESRGLQINIYDAKDTGFVKRLKYSTNGNVLIVGHSNTVDDIVNGFLGYKYLSDLPDNQYGDLFVIKRKGKKFKLNRRNF